MILKNKDKIPLILALSIPILMVLFLALSIYWPTWGVHPKTNFLYCSGDTYVCSKFIVKDNKLTEQEVKYPDYYKIRQDAKLFIYDVVKDSSKEISYEQAKELILNSNLRSPDDFEIVSDSSGGYGVFPFFYSSYSYGQKYLRRGNFSRKLQINARSNYAYYDDYQFNFIGWIIKGE